MKNTCLLKYWAKLWLILLLESWTPSVSKNPQNISTSLYTNSKTTITRGSTNMRLQVCKMKTIPKNDFTNFLYQNYICSPSLRCPCTMLHKLSKCEVKAWPCRNLKIFLPLRFYVKSTFGEFKRSKNANLDNVRGSQFWSLVNLCNFQVPNLPKFQGSESLKLPKMTFLDCLNSPKCNFT